MLLSYKKNEWIGNIKHDIFGGLVTSVALIPEVIGFAIVSGVNPITALFASVIMLVVTSLTGGRPAMVSAAAGSMALVMVTLIKTHGIDYMIAATVLTGIIQVVLGYLKINQLMRFVSPPVMAGFINALALLIFMAQIQQLHQVTIVTYLMVIAAIAGMYILPHITQAIPAALIIIVTLTVGTTVFGWNVQTVGALGDMAGSVSGIHLPNVPFTIDTLRIILPTSLTLALVGLVESLLTLPIVDEMTDSVGDSQREVKAQGLANIMTGFFGGPAGCAMIGQAVINVKSGGRERLSTVTAGGVLFLLIVFFKDIMLQIPTPALIGIMITVAITTFDFNSLKRVKEAPMIESFTMFLTIAIVLYTHNLALGIIVGVLVSMIALVTKISQVQLKVSGPKIVIKGQLFFASVASFNEEMDTISLDNIDIIDCRQLHIIDNSGADALLTWLNENNQALDKIQHVQTKYSPLLNKLAEKNE
ncbi:sulfate permease [Vagococcus penaei]|uniref:Sulfate permease n=1 Tax=Vagococcus penaei TaxID=633807 RepID=A0A1Q2D8E0_9ENTE|nr:SulP family inorganic anion transporter [Vagococcus penaei]AQP54513.1 sulfate permease [Vagococcus penaei]RSU06779.1 sulfate permease [Vagococcus penaei]